MHTPQYSLPLSDPATLRRARRWLLLGVVALGVAGIFAGLLANTKSEYFYTALVVHVDLSVLVWFLTMACMFFTLATQSRGWGMLADAGFYSFALGAFCIALSAFTGGEAYMSNYIPVIHHPVFFLGLGFIACGVVATAANLLVACTARESVQQFGVVSAAFILFIALLCFIWSHVMLPGTGHGQIYYEYAFWGGGHMLQFVHTQLMMVAWLWLCSAAGLSLRLNAKVLTTFFAFGWLVSLVAPFIYFVGDPMTDENRDAFTLMMKHAGGLAPIVLGGAIVYSFAAPVKVKIKAMVSEVPAFAGTTLAKICLVMSMLLFAAGGFLGYLIAGSNVTVPAHYHGSIVGITIAFMGVAYLLLPVFGWADISRSFIAKVQPVIYGGGQLCWMTGMAILGSHGVPRKTPGSADTVGALASFLKHGGDGLALIGGLLFVFVVLKAVWSRRIAEQ